MKMYLPPPGQKSSRRGFLKKGLIGGALLALGGGALFLRESAAVAVPSDGLQALSAKEFAVISALVARFHPPREGFPPHESLKVALGCDRILSTVDPTALTEFKQLLVLFESALPNFLFGLRPRTFTTMAPDEQDAVIAEWTSSRIEVRRTGLIALRTLVMAAYYGQPAAWAAVGYAGPPKGIHEPSAEPWRGGGAARPPGNGVFLEPGAAASPPDAGVTP